MANSIFLTEQPIDSGRDSPDHDRCALGQCMCCALSAFTGASPDAGSLAHQLLSKTDLLCPEHGWRPDVLRVAAANALMAQAAEIARLNSLIPPTTR